jgi:hypothetical protein
MKMAALSINAAFDRAKLMRIADGFAVAVAVVLPWSTSLTGILLSLWAIAVVSALPWTATRRELMSAAGGLPVLLVILGVLGMAWADVSLAARWNGLGSFLKLLAIPLLFAQFRRLPVGLWVLGGYLVSCAALLLATTFVQMTGPLMGIGLRGDKVLIKNAATQSGEFVTCIFGALYLALHAFRRRQWLWAVVLPALALGMLANMVFVSTGRTALVVGVVLLVLFAIKNLSYREAAILFAAAITVFAMAWTSSSYLRARTTAAWIDFRAYQESDAQNSSGERVEFVRKSLGFVMQAPLIGHGTGSIHDLFIRSSLGKTGAQGSATANPHNQTFAVAIQLGLVGAVVLWAMWVAHLLLFRGEGLAAWVGLVVVVQNIVGSLLNSHLFDFGQGWTYVIGVGVAGGMVLKASAKASAMSR